MLTNAAESACGERSRIVEGAKSGSITAFSPLTIPLGFNKLQDFRFTPGLSRP